MNWSRLFGRETGQEEEGLIKSTALSGLWLIGEWNSSSWRINNPEGCVSIHSFTQDFGAERLLCWRLYMQLLCWRWGSTWEKDVWSEQTLLQFFSCLGRRFFRNCCPPYPAISLPPTSRKVSLTWRFPYSDQISVALQRGSGSSSIYQRQSDEWVRWVSPLILLYIVLHQGNYFMGQHKWWGKRDELLLILQGVWGRQNERWWGKYEATPANSTRSLLSMGHYCCLGWRLKHTSFTLF